MRSPHPKSGCANYRKRRCRLTRVSLHSLGCLTLPRKVSTIRMGLDSGQDCYYLSRYFHHAGRLEGAPRIDTKRLGFESSQ